MNLVLKYMTMHRKRIEEEKKMRQMENTSSEWRVIHESTEHKVSVFGGRMTGKTKNILLKALRSDRDVCLYIQSGVSYFVYLDLIQELIEQDIDLPRVEAEFRAENHFVLQMDDRRKIQIFPLPNSIGSSSIDYSWRGRLILVDGFDNEQFEILMEAKRYEIREAHQIICVGTLSKQYVSFGKRWFKSSDVKEFINSGLHVNIHMHIIEEYYPENFKAMLENMPPLDFTDYFEPRRERAYF